MKTLGIVGGIAPESTIAYYRALITGYKRRVSDGSQPPIIINSIDMNKMLGLIGAGRLQEVTDYLVSEVHKLARAGSQFALFASNTPHVVFDDLKSGSPLPLLSITDSAAATARNIGLKRLGLFGTRFTMQARFYPDVFAREGMAVVLPRTDEQEFIHQKYMSELVAADFREETRAALLAIVERMLSDDKIDGLILGGTELPLIFQTDSYRGIPMLDTSLIHAEAALTEMLRN